MGDDSRSIPDHEWRKERRKERFKHKKRDKKRGQFKGDRNKRQHFEDDDDLDFEYRNKYRG